MPKHNFSSLVTVSCLLLAIPGHGLALQQSVDPGGCILEQVAAERGVNQYQYDSFSPDGSSIAIAWDRGESERGTYLLDLQSGQRKDLAGFNNGASFSPDGLTLVNSIYVTEEDTDIALLDVESGKISVIAPDLAWDWLPSFSPDGSKILFNSFRSGNSDLYLYEIDSGKLDRLTDDGTYEAHAQFSPDGKSIVYHEQVSKTDFNLKQLIIESGESIDLTWEKSEESYPSWSPDGELIAFASDRGRETGITDIFIMNRAGKILSRITDSPSKDGYPFFSPDGNYLFFTSYRSPQGVYRTKLTDQRHCLRE